MGKEINKDKRKCVLRNGAEIEMKDLVAGDVFEIYENDGSQVGKHWIAISDSYMEKDIVHVQVDEYK